MKLSIKKESLLKAIQSVDGVIGGKVSLPVLSNLLITSTTGILKVTATNLDLSISCEVPAEVEEGGSITLSESRLAAAAREFIGESVKLKVDNQKMVCCVESGPSKYNLNGIDAAEFPLFQEMTSPKKMTISQLELKQILGRAAFAMSDDPARYVLCGTMIEAGVDSIKAAAADGRRLVVVSAKGSAANPISAIIPAKAAACLERLLGTEGDVSAEFSESTAKFVVGGVTIQTKLIDGAYPNVSRIIPSSFKHRIEVPREEVAGALRRVSIMTSDKWQSVKLSFSANLLTITSNTPEVGDATESLALKYQGEDLEIAFNPKYLTDALGVLRDKNVYFELIDGVSPMVIKIEDPFIYVVSPMRLN